MNLKSAFLNAEYEEEVYVKQPDGYVKKGKQRAVIKVNRALYILKKALQA